MDSCVKRIFVGGLPKDIAEKDLHERFSKFGVVENIEIKLKNEEDEDQNKLYQEMILYMYTYSNNVRGIPGNTFAYINLNTTEENLKTCFSILNKSRWKGRELKLQYAKPDFMKRLEVERKNNFEVATPESKKNKKIFNDPLQGIPGVENFHMKGAVPGTLVNVEDKNWVVGKYGRVLPIVHIRRKDRKKVLTVDPSKFCHNSKRMKEGETENIDTDIQRLTWAIDTKDSEYTKRKKGDYPEWKPKKKKKEGENSDTCWKSLADYMEHASNTESQTHSTKTDFEVVPEGYLTVSQKPTYFSEESDTGDVHEESDSEENHVKNVTSSLPCDNNSNHSQSKFSTELGNISNAMDKPDSSREIQIITNREKHLNIVEKSQTEKKLTKLDKDIKDGSTSSKMSPTVFSDNKTSSSKKPKLQTFGGTRQLYDKDPANTKQKENLQVVAGSTVSNKTNSPKKPKLQTFGGTRQLYDKDPTNTKQKENLQAVAGSTVSRENHIELQNEECSEAKFGIKRVLFQSSEFENSLDKSNDSKNDSDNDSVSSADTDIVIASAKKQRKSNTVIGYGSLETPVSLQTSINNDRHSEFGSGLVDGEMSFQSDWLDEHAGNMDESSDEEDDFEKLVKKLSEKNLLSTSSTSGGKEGRKNKEVLTGETEIKNLAELENDFNDKYQRHHAGDEEAAEGSDDSSSSDDDNDDEEEKVDSKIDGFVSSDIDNSVVTSPEISPQIKDKSKSQDKKSKKETADKVTDKNGSAVKKNKVSSEEAEKHQNVDEIGRSKHNEDKVKQAKEANQKKLESLRQKQEEYKTRKSIIKQALAQVDGVKKSNRIVFESSSDEDDLVNDDANKTAKSTSPQSEKTSWDLEDSEEDNDSDSSDDDSSADDSEDESNDDNKKNQSMDTMTQKQKLSLFDGSSSDEADDEREAFKLKPQFEGEGGQKLMKLQMGFSNDSRFKLDERFAENDDEEEENEEDNEKFAEDEKTRALKVLQQVVGGKVGTVPDKKEQTRKTFKDISALQYDPSREDHKSFEVQPAADSRLKKGKDSKKKKAKDKQDEEMDDAPEPLPEVSTEKFYEVSNSLENAFKKKADEESENNTEGFSLLAAFGSRKEDDYEEETQDKQEGTTEKLQWQGFNFHDSSDDEDDRSSGSDAEEEQKENSEKEKNTAVFTSVTDSFFFTEDDERIKEGISKFCRQDDLETIRERWLEKRPDLVKAYRAKHKRAVRNKRQLEKKRTSLKHH